MVRTGPFSVALLTTRGVPISCHRDEALGGARAYGHEVERTKGGTVAGSTGQTPVLDLLARMTEDSIAVSGLSPQALMLVRIAALVAVDAPPVSYSTNAEAMEAVGIDAEAFRGILAAVAPIVGTARVASATSNIVKALAIELDIAELDQGSLD